MAIQKKETVPVAQNSPVPPPNVHLEEGGDDDSDPGSSLDDDTEDFLPSAWVGSEKKKTVSDYKPRKRRSAKMKAEVLQVSSPAMAKRPTPKHDPQPAPTTSSLEADISALSITNDGSTTVLEFPTCRTSISSTGTATESKQSTVTISRLQVPASLIRQPLSTLELLQEQVKSLKREVERKDKDVKYANQRIIDHQLAKVKAEEEAKKIQIDLQAKIKSLQDELGEAVPMMKLRMERDEIEVQRQKATSDLMKLREKHEKVVKRFSIASKKLITANEDLAKVNVELNQMSIEKSELDQTIERLNRDATSSRISQQRLQETLGQEQANVGGLQSTNNDLIAQVSTLTEQLSVARNTASRSTASPRISAETQNAIHKYRSLQGSHDKLRRDYSKALRDIKDLEEERDSYINDYQQVRKERDSAKGRARRFENDNGRLASANRRLEDENEELEEERDLLDPILQIGVDIRLRNLEWARETTLGVPAGDIDRAIIRRGNIAAHRANGAVDAALFEADLVPEEYIEEASRVFEEMYEVVPSNIGKWSAKALRLTDCQATIRSLKAVKNSGDSAALRGEYKKLENSLINDYNSMWKANFETDLNVDHQLARLEEATEEIVDIERSKGGRRRRSRRSGKAGNYDSDEDDD